MERGGGGVPTNWQWRAQCSLLQGAHGPASSSCSPSVWRTKGSQLVYTGMVPVQTEPAEQYVNWERWELQKTAALALVSHLQNMGLG